MAQKIPDFPDIVASLQAQTLTWSISLPSGITFTGSPTLTISQVTVASSDGAVDPAPQTRLVSGPTVLSDGVSIAARLANCIGGVMYLLTLSCDRSDGDTFAAFNHIYCVSPA